QSRGKLAQIVLKFGLFRGRRGGDRGVGLLAGGEFFHRDELARTFQQVGLPARRFALLFPQMPGPFTNTRLDRKSTRLHSSHSPSFPTRRSSDLSVARETRPDCPEVRPLPRAAGR